MTYAVLRWLFALAFVAALSQPLSAAAQPAPAPFCDSDEPPTFHFGFASLKAVLGDVMGDPVECEHANSDNGDTLQQTTTGLAVYRHATNAPEFTDGWNHWALSGPGVVAWSGSDQPPTATAGQPGPRPAQPPASTQCVDVGDNLCLKSAADLADTVALLAKTTTVPPLLRSAARDGYTIQFGRLPPNVLGLFRPNRHEVVINAELRSYPTLDLGPVLAHELQHVSDWISLGRELNSTEGCLATESNAFHTESAAWLELRSGRLSPPANDLEQEFNAITRAIQTDPTGFANRMTLAYQDECSGQ